MVRWQVVRSGVTRIVLLTPRYAFKLPRGYRGVLANESEWSQRHRPDVNSPLRSPLHLVQISRRAEKLFPGGTWAEEREAEGYSQEEAKSHSWGRFGDRWLLIDFDRAWAEPRGLLARPYYARQERLARKWMKL
jgi:hypothetical protein